MKSSLPLARSDELLTSGGREVLKWLALVLMTGDHANKVLQLDMPFLTDMSRVVFPIFAVVFACNLRLEDRGGSAWHSAWRTLAVALMAQPLHAWAFGYALPVNVLFTLAAGAFVLLLWRDGMRAASVVLFVFAGLCVDYSWYGLAVIVTAALAMRRDDPWFWPVGLAVASLFMINGNWYALGALPLIAIVGQVDLSVPRWRWTFLAYYVLHLAVLAGVERNVFPTVFDPLVSPALYASLAGA